MIHQLYTWTKSDLQTPSRSNLCRRQSEGRFVLSGQSGLRQRYQSSCAIESGTFTGCYSRSYETPLTTYATRQNFRSVDNYRSSSVRSPRGRVHPRSIIALPSPRRNRAAALNSIVDPFRSVGIGSVLDPADRTSARSRRSSLRAPPTYDCRDSAWWRNKPSGRRRQVAVSYADDFSRIIE